ncbi:MAG: type II toxin-antitoxin system HicB family antitoxin [Nitrospirota bacterium]|nr:type II toxin-antitoxin system HicB family antitoxin [Nitrospirota bacterium]
MGTVDRKMISISPDLYKELEELAQEEGKSVNAVVQEALRMAQRERQKSRFLDIQQYWTRKTKEKGNLTERNLHKYLAK